MQTLKKKKEFQRVFDLGRWVTRKGSPIRVRATSAEDLRIGIVAPRKSGNAVRRNKARRQLKEITRNLEKEAKIASGHFVLLLSKAFVELDFSEKKDRIENIFSRFLAKQG